MGMLFSSNALITPMCAVALAPPPLNTNPIFCPFDEVTIKMAHNKNNILRNRRFFIEMVRIMQDNI
jgi:hypothetical protein